ncbi:hypothetical protein B296_00053688 [Ensete ventricosum]|uniref:Uncharacterized protein n=1 Tax=Ensete ventricosum TaxID=4639 RepID=A0A426X4G3_ENSVE|nr:hypothetical protein B296_00053688 [Ensete ventricosum]
MNLGLRKYGSQKMPKENNETRRNSYTRLLVAGSEVVYFGRTIGVKFFSEVFFLIGRVLRWHEPRDDKRKYDFGMMQGLAKVKSMHRVDTFGNSSGVCRKLAEGIESLPGWRKEVRQKKNDTRQKIVGGNRKAYRDSDDVLGSRWKFARRFAEGIGKLAGNTKGDR